MSEADEDLPEPLQRFVEGQMVNWAIVDAVREYLLELLYARGFGSSAAYGMGHIMVSVLEPDNRPCEEFRLGFVSMDAGGGRLLVRGELMPDGVARFGYNSPLQQQYELCDPSVAEQVGAAVLALFSRRERP